jgi:hypothetical protein
MQCALLLLRYCDLPRFSHVLRTLPPNTIASKAAAHHTAIMNLIFLGIMTRYAVGTRLSPLRAMPPTKLQLKSLVNRLPCHSVSEASAWSTRAPSLTPPS